MAVCVLLVDINFCFSCSNLLVYHVFLFDCSTYTNINTQVPLQTVQTEYTNNKSIIDKIWFCYYVVFLFLILLVCCFICANSKSVEAHLESGKKKSLKVKVCMYVEGTTFVI